MCRFDRDVLRAAAARSSFKDVPTGADMGKEPYLELGLISGRTSCAAREGVIFNRLRCQHVAGALPWFLLRDRQILPYQRGAEADRTVKDVERDGQTQRARRGEKKGERARVQGG